jgi:hypothetical protein
MYSASTALFAAYPGERSASGEIVPSGHYDIVFRWVGTVYGTAKSLRYSLCITVNAASNATHHTAPP